MLALSKMLMPPISIDSIQLTQVPPPKAAKRAPPIGKLFLLDIFFFSQISIMNVYVGYDMRTLRKQLEFLSEVT